MSRVMPSQAVAVIDQLFPHSAQNPPGDVVISPPYAWQRRFNASDVGVRARIQNRVETNIIEELERKFVDFRRAYAENGLALEEFDTFPPTRRTLRQFIAACCDLEALIRDFLLPNPDM